VFNLAVTFWSIVAFLDKIIIWLLPKIVGW